MRSEIKIRLTDANLEQMKTGRLVIDIEAPGPDIEIQHSPLNFNDLPQRVIPSGKNNFRRHKPCCDCAAYAYKANTFTCTKKTFNGDCYRMAAMSMTCDKWQPKLKLIKEAKAS